MDPMSIIFSILAAGAVICGALALILSTTRNQNKDTETSKTERTKITADVEIKKAELKDEENKRLAKIEENKLTVATAVVNKTIEKIEPGEKISVNLSAAGVNQTYDRSRVTPEPQCSPRCAGQAQSQSINLGQPQQGGHLDGNVLTDASLKNILDTKFSAVLRPAQQPKQDPPAA